MYAPACRRLDVGICIEVAEMGGILPEKQSYLDF